MGLLENYNIIKGFWFEVYNFLKVNKWKKKLVIDGR